jgi:predicted transposase YbfD/YdcC
LDGQEVDTAVGSWASACTEPAATGPGLIAVDGKRVRGSGSDTTDARHLLGAIDHAHGVVLAQREVGAKTNEITEFALLLDTVELTNTVVTADAMPAQQAHADHRVLKRRAHYLLTVKSNQPALPAQLKALPWKDVPVTHASSNRAHGRVENRTVKVVTGSTGILFPHARQAIQITGKTRTPKSKKWTTEVAYAITNRTAEQATSRELAAGIRRHQHIKNRLHRVHDVTFNEDHSQIHTGNDPTSWHPCPTSPSASPTSTAPPTSPKPSNITHEIHSSQ